MIAISESFPKATALQTTKQRQRFKDVFRFSPTYDVLRGGLYAPEDRVDDQPNPKRLLKIKRKR